MMAWNWWSVSVCMMIDKWPNVLTWLSPLHGRMNVKRINIVHLTKSFYYRLQPFGRPVRYHFDCELSWYGGHLINLELDLPKPIEPNQHTTKRNHYYKWISSFKMNVNSLFSLLAPNPNKSNWNSTSNRAHLLFHLNEYTDS